MDDGDKNCIQTELCETRRTWLTQVVVVVVVVVVVIIIIIIILNQLIVTY